MTRRKNETTTNDPPKYQHPPGTEVDRHFNAEASLLNLVRLAERLGPEGEGLDLSDIGDLLFDEDLAALRSKAATMRSAIDEVNRALARTWAERLPDPRAVRILEGGRVARLSWTKPLPRWIDGTGLAFVDFMLTQAPELIARAFSTQTRDRKTLVPAIQKSAVPPGAFDTFVIIRHDDKPTPSLEVSPMEMVDTKWIRRLSEGMTARYNAQTRKPEIYDDRAPSDDVWVQMADAPTEEDA